MPDPARLECSRLYSEELGIDLSAQTDAEYFRWFLASLLFGGHIGETIARRTYHSFCHHRLTTPRRILAAGWDFLVNPIMPRASASTLGNMGERRLPSPGSKPASSDCAASIVGWQRHQVT
jgi:hypothetical protein